MINLSTINAESPYEILSGPDLFSFCFQTADCVNYTVSFVETTPLFNDESLKLYSILVSSNGKSHVPVNTGTAICCIIRELLNNNVALFFVCDDNDGRKDVRLKLFTNWFRRFNFNQSVDFISFSIEEFVGGLLISKIHPLYSEYLDNAYALKATSGK